jgi:hypothetical protein
VAWSDLKVLHLMNEGPEPKGEFLVEVETVEGALFVTAQPPETDGEQLVLRPRAMPDRLVRLHLKRIRVVRARGGDFVYASDLHFESEFTHYYPTDPLGKAYRSRWYEARANRRRSGCPLRLGGKTYRHGFAVQSHATVRLRLDRAYARFESLFGVDDEALGIEPGGIVDARVLGDGKVLWEGRDVRAGAAPRRVGPLDVTQVEELVLEVDFGAEQHFGDRATWADPILHRR